MAGLWTLAIFATVPVARALQKVVSQHLGRPTFGYLTLAALAVALAFTVRYLVRSRRPATSYLWLALVAAIFTGYTFHLWREPEEALHFVQYGILGALFYRALCHRVHDASIYVAASMLGAITGMLDEILQWVTPGRFWGLRDIWIDLLAVALVQLAIAKGLKPAIISGPPRPASVRMLCRVGVLLLAVLAMTLLNTPRRIAWYTEQFPALDFLRHNPSAMFEYGYRFVDPEAGPFRSRLSLEALRRADSERGAEAGRILAEHRGRMGYEQFLRRYSPVSDPFVHEARVHIYRRDRHLQWARGHEPGAHQRRIHETVAWRENRILEEYFPTTVRHAGYRFGAEQVADLESQLLPESELPAREVESTVSRDLVTRIDEGQILALLGAALLALALVERRYGR